jgi:opacity protein-like surface antigen
MKKLALGLLVALIAASPAAAAKKAKKAVEAAPAKIDSNEASWRFVRDSLPIYLPSWSMPIYMAIRQQQEAAAEPKSKKR